MEYQDADREPLGGPLGGGSLYVKTGMVGRYEPGSLRGSYPGGAANVQTQRGKKEGPHGRGVRVGVERGGQRAGGLGGKQSSTLRSDVGPQPLRRLDCMGDGGRRLSEDPSELLAGVWLAAGRVLQAG